MSPETDRIVVEYHDPMTGRFLRSYLVCSCSELVSLLEFDKAFESYIESVPVEEAISRGWDVHIPLCPECNADLNKL